MRTESLIRKCTMGLVAALLLPVFASAQTLDRIRDQGVLNVGYVTDAAPFSFEAGNGAKGYSIDLCKKVAEGVKARLGLSALNVKYTATDVQGGLASVASGDVDILCGSTTDTLQRREQVSFSLPIYNGGIGALVNDDASKELTRVLEGKVAHTGPKWRATINQGLANHNYAVHKGTVTEAWVREQIAGLGVTANIVTVDDHLSGVKMVADGKADVYFADRAILADQAREQKGVALYKRYFTYEPIALAVARDDSDMRLVVDTALSNLYRSPEFKQFYATHFGEPGDVTLMFFKSFSRQ